NVLKDGKLLLVFEITGEKSTGTIFNYTVKETGWATDNGSIYGANKATNANFGYGANHGPVLYYDLDSTLQDDISEYRGW
ncbi:MAG: hypothetical protein AB7G87_04890, partial [Clostridia bacterium]